MAMSGTRALRPAIATPLDAIRIAIVDNDRRSLEALADLVLDLVPHGDVAWLSTSASEAVARCLERPEALDLLVLDMSLEGLQGPGACRRIRRADGRLPILAVTSFSLNRYRDEVAQAGAQALVSKNEEAPLARMMLETARGMVAEGFDSPAHAHARLLAEPADSHLLSPREADVMDLCAEGLSDRQIAEVLSIAEATVRKHLQHIDAKFGVHTSRQAVSRWLRRND